MPSGDPLQQRRVWFAGHVQGVRFRYTTHRLATGFEVTGYVRNLDDGRVELVAEGSAREIDQLLASIRQAFGDQIRRETSDTRPATGQYTTFEIKH